MPFLLPLGAPPRAPWNRHTVQPLTAGALHRSFDRFEVAEQRRARFISSTRFMRLPVLFARSPTPGYGMDIADDGLSAIVHMNMFNADCLFAPTSQSG